jgi:hypothetical protein
MKRVRWNLNGTVLVLAAVAAMLVCVTTNAWTQDRKPEESRREPNKEHKRHSLDIDEKKLLKPEEVKLHHLMYVAHNAKRDCSTFDLGPQGRMHLHWGERYDVYPLLPRGNLGMFHVYEENSPYRWLWAFSELAAGNGYLIYYKPSGEREWYLLDNTGSRYPRLP